MFIYHENHTMSFSIFEEYPELLCKFSTRQLGNFRSYGKSIQGAQIILKLFDIKPDIVVAMAQSHNKHVAFVEKDNGGTVINETDGMVTLDKNLFLGTIFADCVPLFFYDHIKKVIAVCHAGWRGTILKIVEQIIFQMLQKGARIDNIVVAIGPHIGACCYDVSEIRARKFLNYFNDSRVVFKSENKWRIDLGQANKILLKKLGITDKQIDSPICCTACQSDKFFSYRKDTRETFGEMLGLIGLKN